jgi:hypothetical protein
MVRFFSLIICLLVVLLVLNTGCTSLQNSPAAGAAPALGTTVPTQVSSPGVITPTVLPVQAATTSSGTCPPDIQNDPANCGGCGNSCPANAICQAGQCYCRDGYTASSNQCIAAAAPAVTVAGNGCPAGMSPCPDGYCYELASSPANCGSCGNSCPSGLTCSASACTATTPDVTTVVTTSVTTTTPVSPNVTLVKPGFTLAGPLVVNCAVLGKTSCSGFCVNISTDAVNCGSCGMVCIPASPNCCNGGCVNFQTDPANCGSCGHSCGALSSCSAGSCTVKTVIRVPVTLIKPVASIPVYQPIYQPAGP